MLEIMTDAARNAASNSASLPGIILRTALQACVFPKT